VDGITPHNFSATHHRLTMIVGNLQELMDNIWAGNGFSLSNGLFQVGRGAAAWIIEGKTNENCLIGTCLSPGDDNGHSSFQNKLAGIYVILFTLSMLLLTTTEITPFRLACDGKLVLMQLRWYHITDPNKPHADLLLATRHLMKHCGAQVDLHHIKGHQDSKKCGLYTRDVMLNIKAHKLAREKLETYQPGPKSFHIPWSQGVCYAGNHQIAKDFATTIRDHMNRQKTIEYWTKQRMS